MSFAKLVTTLLLVATLGTLSVGFVAPLLLHAQTAAAVASYSATVVNRSKGEIYFKIVGGQGKGFVDGNLQANHKTAQPVTRGEKVVCVWDGNGSLLAAWRLWVAGNCTITLPDFNTSTQANYSEPGNGVVDMQWDSGSSVAPRSGAPLPSIERKPN